MKQRFGPTALFIAAAWLLQSSGVFAQTVPTVDAIKARVTHTVRLLTSPELGGRPPGTEQEAMAAQRIVEAFMTCDLPTHFAPFDVRLGADSTLHCRNVIGMLDNGADSTIVVGAHYDHLGMGSGKSREILRKGVHLGADDNASGVAVMLELARWTAGDSLMRHGKYNLVFVAFSAHEIGLYGSSDFAASSFFEALRVKLFINLDMVGRLDKNERRVRVNHCHDQPTLSGCLGDGGSIKFIYDGTSSAVNDFSVFCNRCVPSISLTTGLHDDYHRISDTPEKLNYVGMVELVQLLEEQLGKMSAKAR